MENNINTSSWPIQREIEPAQNRYNAGNSHEHDPFWSNRVGLPPSNLGTESNYSRPNSVGSSDLITCPSTVNNDETSEAVSFLDFLGKKTQPSTAPPPACSQLESSQVWQTLNLLKSQSIINDVLSHIGQDSSISNRSVSIVSDSVLRSNSPRTFSSNRLDVYNGRLHNAQTIQDSNSSMSTSPIDDNDSSSNVCIPNNKRSERSHSSERPDNSRPHRSHETSSNKRSHSDDYRNFIENKHSRTDDWSSGGRSSRSRSEEAQETTVRDGRIAWNYISMGNIRTGAVILSQQIGLVNIEPYRKFISRAMLKSSVVIGMFPEFPLLSQKVGRKYENEGNLSVRVDAVVIDNLLERASRTASCAKFEKAITRFRDILLWITLTVVESEEDEHKVKEAVKMCQAYILALEMDLKRKTIAFDTLENKKKICELTAYVADCDILPIHKQITVRVALTFSYKMGNLKTTAGFCKRLLELDPKPDAAMLAQLILERCNDKLEDEHKLNYEEQKTYSVCAITHEPIYDGESKVCCPYCGANYLPEHKGRVCTICNLCEIGRKSSGLSVLFRNKRESGMS